VTGRLEPLSLGWYIPAMVSHVILFILCIIFRGQQPLKSRGITPFLSCVCQLMLLLREFPTFVTLETFQAIVPNVVIIESLLYDSPILMIIFLQLLLFARYLILTMLNQRKVLFVIQQTKQREGPISMKWNWRLLKLSGNNGINNWVVYNISNLCGWDSFDKLPRLPIRILDLQYNRNISIVVHAINKFAPKSTNSE
jgi:hypothetical protein